MSQLNGKPYPSSEMGLHRLGISNLPIENEGSSRFVRLRVYEDLNYKDFIKEALESEEKKPIQAET